MEWLKSRGFTLLEMLLGLSFLSLLFLLFYGLLALVTTIKEGENFVDQQQLFELQLQHEWMLSSNFEMDENGLCYVLLSDEARCLNHRDQRLVKTPGYEILLFDVKSLRVELHTEEIILNYEYQGVLHQSHFQRLKK